MAIITYDVVDPDGSRRTVTETIAPELVNQQAMQSRAQAALAANATFQALAAPTSTQTLAQVQLLTKECNALIRLALDLLDSTAGT